MALIPSEENGMLWLKGVTADSSVLAPLGRFYWKIAPHYLGIDDSFREPVIVRAYYDPSQDERLLARLRGSGTLFVGYMQFMQVRFAGQVVPPQVYGGHLADHGPYATEDSNFQFVDFMGPAQAVVLRGNAGKLDPFYAYNGALLDGTIKGYTDLGTYPRRNGVFLLGQPLSGVPQQAHCASLVTALAPGLLTEAHVEQLLNEDNHLRTIQGDLAHMEAFAIALNDMQARGELTGLTNADISGRVVGKYALIELPNEEDMPPSVCVHVKDGKVVIHIIAYHELKAAEDAAVMDSLRRMAAYVEEKGQQDVPMEIDIAMDMAPVGSGRGKGGLDALPSRFNRTGNIVEWSYTTFLFAKTQRMQTRAAKDDYDLSPLHGFSWSAIQTFDSDSRTLTLSSIKAPKELTTFDARPALLGYFKTIESYSKNKHPAPNIDLSNFTLAAMRLANLGDASIKLRAVNDNGTPATNVNGLFFED